MVSTPSMNISVQTAIWRGLALEAAKAATQLHDSELRLRMLSIAASYEALAQRAEAMGQGAAATGESAPGAGSQT